MTTGYRRIVLAGHPSGKAELEHSRLETVPMPSLAEVQVLVRNHWLSRSAGRAA